MTGLNLWSAIVVMGLVATTYTTLGGMAAVIWTDVVQFLILALGAVLITLSLSERRWCMNRNWPATNPTHRSITYQERTTMAYRARPSG